MHCVIIWIRNYGDGWSKKGCHKHKGAPFTKFLILRERRAFNFYPYARSTLMACWRMR